MSIDVGFAAPPWVVGHAIATGERLDMSRAGNCYELSARLIVGLDDGSWRDEARAGWRLVHGTIKGFGFPALAHAWVEDPDSGRAWEPFGDRWYPKAAFDAYFNATPGASYTRSEAAAKLVGYRHFGPWDDANPPLPDYDDDEDDDWGDDDE